MKFTKDIGARKIGTVTTGWGWLRSRIDPSEHSPGQYEYEVGIVLGARAIAGDSAAEVAHIHRDQTRLIFEILYGELRRPLIEVRMAVHRREAEDALAALDRIDELLREGL